MDTIQPLRIEKTAGFAKWLSGLRDLQGKAAIVLRLRRASLGQLGDVRSVGGGVSEMRVDVGPGYRLYYTRRAGRLILLLVGGAKVSQTRDIARAKALVKEMDDEDHSV